MMSRSVMMTMMTMAMTIVMNNRALGMLTILYKYGEIVKKSKFTIFFSCVFLQNIVMNTLSVSTALTQGPYHAQTLHKKNIIVGVGNPDN